MTNRKQLKLTQEFREAYESIATPDFSAEDWIKLHENANKGCRTSATMLCKLLKRKLEPYLSPEFKEKIEEEFRNDIWNLLTSYKGVVTKEYFLEVADELFTNLHIDDDWEWVSNVPILKLEKEEN